MTNSHKNVINPFLESSTLLFVTFPEIVQSKDRLCGRTCAVELFFNTVSYVFDFNYALCLEMLKRKGFLKMCSFSTTSYLFGNAQMPMLSEHVRFQLGRFLVVLKGSQHDTYVLVSN